MLVCSLQNVFLGNSPDARSCAGLPSVKLVILGEFLLIYPKIFEGRGGGAPCMLQSCVLKVAILYPLHN